MIKFAVIAVVVIALPIVLLAAGIAMVGGTMFASASQPSQHALADIPASYLVLYRQAAATCPGLDWSVLAAVGKIETDHGRSSLPGVHEGSNFAGAQGVMQFEPATFARYNDPVPPGGAQPASPYDPTDAIYAAARMLCANGARDGRDLHGALLSYNHAEWYVTEVLTQAEKYKNAQEIGIIAAPSAAAQIAINYAKAQLGLPYVWGGNGAADGGFDCSGLTKAAYQAAGIELPRTAQTQYDAGPKLPPNTPLTPGDLVFYGTPENVHHVGLFTGNGQMIDAPDFGQVVKIEPYLWRGADYLGARRIVNQGNL